MITGHTYLCREGNLDSPHGPTNVKVASRHVVRMSCKTSPKMIQGADSGASTTHLAGLSFERTRGFEPVTIWKGDGHGTCKCCRRSNRIVGSAKSCSDLTAHLRYVSRNARRPDVALA